MSSINSGFPSPFPWESGGERAEALSTGTKQKSAQRDIEACVESIVEKTLAQSVTVESGHEATHHFIQKSCSPAGSAEEVHERPTLVLHDEENCTQACEEDSDPRTLDSQLKRPMLELSEDEDSSTGLREERPSHYLDSAEEFVHNVFDKRPALILGSDDTEGGETGSGLLLREELGKSKFFLEQDFEGDQIFVGRPKIDLSFEESEESDGMLASGLDLLVDDDSLVDASTDTARAPRQPVPEDIRVDRVAMEGLGIIRQVQARELSLGSIKRPLAVDFQPLGNVSADSIAIVHAVAQRVLETSSLAELQSYQKVRVSMDSVGSSSLGEEHVFKVIHGDMGSVSLVSPFMIDRGTFKKVLLGVDLREEGSRLGAFGISRSTSGFDGYSRMHAPEILNAEPIDGEEVVRRMVSLRNVPHIASPHLVVTSKGHELHGGLMFPVMDRGSYKTLFNAEMRKKMVENEQDFNRAIGFLTDVATGLCSIHERGWMHGDIKPANLMAQEQVGGSVKGFVTDLDGLSAPQYTRWMRTPYYLSPQTMKIGEVEGYDWKKDDVWSLGMTYFELLTGDMLYSKISEGFLIDFLGDTLKDDQSAAAFDQKVAHVIETDISADLPHSDKIKELLRSMLAVKGEARFTMEEVRAKLTEIKG